MIMMCLYYCIPFAKIFFFIFSVLLFVFALFMLKRGVRQSRPKLRQWAFFTMFLALLKFFTADLFFLKEKLLCDFRLFNLGCGAAGFQKLQALGLIGLTVVSLFLFNFYRNYIHERKALEVPPEQTNLRLWANISMTFVMVVILWLAAPWVGYLTVGHIPKLFMEVPWEYLAVANAIALLIGFWKLEDCLWAYQHSSKKDTDKKKRHHVNNTRTPKDTLWLAAILFLITLAFSYASHDVLTLHGQLDKAM
jgi:hypothetical protein